MTSGGGRPPKRKAAMASAVDSFIELQMTTEFTNFLISTRKSRRPERIYTAFEPIIARAVDEKFFWFRSEHFQEPLRIAEADPVTHKIPFKSKTRFSHFKGRLFGTTDILLGRPSWDRTNKKV
jgi:hypothetical protein